MQSQTSNDTLGTANPGKTTTVPATSQEMQEAIKALLMFGNPPEQATPDLDDNEILMPITGPQNQDVPPVPPALPVVNLLNNPEDAIAPKPGTVLGVAIKTDQTDNNPNVDDQPLETANEDNQADDKNVKKKTFVTKDCGLK